jgi:60 kDa SS-A/Ro ribonucleoprotein
MASSYADHVQTKQTDQRQPVRGKNQIANNEGGFVFAVTPFTRLQRFLILGHEHGSYYAGARKLTVETVECIDQCLQADYTATVDLIVDISTNGRAPKNDPAVFALAYVAGHHKGTPASKYALSKLNSVCRIGTHLADFLNAVTQFRGWGDSLKNAVANWYLDRGPYPLAKQVTKYASRNGWSHRDILRKAHPAAGGLTQEVLQYVTQFDKWLATVSVDHESDTNQYLMAVNEAKTASKSRVIRLIEDHGLEREHIPTELQRDPEVWEALLPNLGVNAILRNLGRLSNIGLLKPLGGVNGIIEAKLTDVELLKAQRSHPVAALIAQKQYEKGRGDKGSLAWNVVPQIVDLLEQTVMLSFDAVEPTGKNFYLGVDVSASMDMHGCGGTPYLKCVEGAMIMALLTAKTESNYYVKCFSREGERHTTWGNLRQNVCMHDLDITARDTFRSARQKGIRSCFGGTDCSLPMLDAIDQRLDVDVFCVYTDNETYAGNIHPYQALEKYRQYSGRPAKLAVFALQGNNFSIADSNDAGMMDFVGFDTASPTILADFAVN